MSELNENTNVEQNEEYTPTDVIEKELKKSKIKLIIKSVCLVLSLFSSVLYFISGKMLHTDVSSFIKMAIVILGLIGYAATLVSNAGIGVIKQWLKFCGFCGGIVPVIGLLIGGFFGIIGAVIVPVLYNIVPLKNEIEKYSELKLM